MKLGKLSLVAVMALGTSAFAIDNVKVNGEAKLFIKHQMLRCMRTGCMHCGYRHV